MDTNIPPVATTAMSYPIRFELPYKQSLSQLTTFFRVILIIPHGIVLSILGLLTQVCVLLAWFAIVITGTMPRGLFDLVVNVTRWGANVQAYGWLLRDEYPPFSWDAGQYPVNYEVSYTPERSRLTTFFRLITAIPAVFVVYFVSLVAGFLVLLAWFAIVFTGSFPRGMFDFVNGAVRWQVRVNGYCLLLTDEYPPFSMT